MPTSLEAVFILVLLVVPGFICWRLINTQTPITFVSDTHSIITSLVLSVMIHAVLSPWTLSISHEFRMIDAALSNWESGATVTIDIALVAWLLGVLVFVPVLLAFLTSTVWKAKFAQKPLSFFGISIVDLTPKAWDWVFVTQGSGCWIVAELTDGNLVGGEYGKNSFASLSPNEHDLFLENVYDVDRNHNFNESLPDNIGVWINANQVSKLYFYRAGGLNGT